MLHHTHTSKPAIPLRYTTWYAAGFFTIYLVISFLPFVFASGQTVDALSKEDNFYECIGAASLFLSAILLLVQYLFDTHGNDFGFFRTKKNLFLLCLALLFFFGFGEEISWGQRIFDIETPDFFMKYNAQQEINLHNITFFHGQDANNLRKTGASRLTGTDFLFSLFWFSFAVLLPLAERHLRRVRNVIRRINVPIPPMWIGVLMVGTYSIAKLLEQQIPAAQSHDLTEVKESDLELLLYAYSLLMFGRSEAFTVFQTMLRSRARFWHLYTPHPKRYSPAKNNLPR